MSRSYFVCDYNRSEVSEMRCPVTFLATAIVLVASPVQATATAPDYTDKAIAGALIGVTLVLLIAIFSWVTRLLRRAAQQLPSTVNAAARSAGRITTKAQRSVRGVIESYKEGKNEPTDKP